MIDFLKLPSPCYVLDEELLDRNLATVDRVRRESGAEIIVALKACAMWSIFPELAKHSDGATASSAAEARLVFEEFGRPAHTYAPVYTDSNIDEILNCSDHITFNSLSQFRRFGQKALITRWYKIEITNRRLKLCQGTKTARRYGQQNRNEERNCGNCSR